MWILLSVSITMTLAIIHRLKSVPKAVVLPFYGDTDRLLKDGLHMEKERSQSLGSVYQVCGTSMLLQCS